MENDGRMGLRCVVPPEQAEHAALKEYATIRLMQVLSERDAAIVERDNALAEKKSALSERDSAFLQRDIAFAERDAAILERENAMAALGAARGHHRALGWGQYKRQHLELTKGRDAATMLQMSLPNAPFGVDEAHPYVNDASMFGFVNSFGKVHQQQQQSQAQAQSQAQPQAQAQQQQLQQQQDLLTQQKSNSKSRKKETSKTKRKAADDGSKLDVKKKRDANMGQDQENVVSPLVVPPPAASYHGQEIALTPPQKNETNLGTDEMKEVEYVINTPIPHCSCTGAFQPCYRWGNGGWQSACCTTTLSMHPLPMNPLKKGYRLPGRKMSAGAFQKLVRRLAQEGVDLSQPIDLKDFWAKHGTNRYVTIK